MPSNLSKFGDKQMNQILKLQQLFHNKYLTADFLHQLVALYVRAIQMFNQDCTFMRTYFLDKMQFVVSRPEIINLLEKGGDTVEQIRETLRITENDDAISRHDRFQPQVQTQKMVVEKQTHHHYHYEQSDSKNKERNMKIDMKVKVMREVEQNLKVLQQEVKLQDKKLQQKGVLVKQIAKGQQDMLQQRLGKRKKRPRKKTEQAKPNLQDDQNQPKPIIQKQQLIEAHRELTIAVTKFTIRMTEKANQQSQKNEQKFKGRVKMRKIESIEEDEDLLEDQQQSPIKKPTQSPIMKKETKPQGQGRIKTRRNDDDQSEYW